LIDLCDTCLCEPFSLVDFLWCMTRSSGSILVEPDPEIERTLHQRRVEHQQIPSEESTTEMEEAQRTMMDYAKPSFDGTNSSITRPVVAANTFEIKPTVIQMIQNTVQFGGLQVRTQTLTSQVS